MLRSVVPLLLFVILPLASSYSFVYRKNVFATPPRLTRSSSSSAAAVKAVSSTSLRMVDDQVIQGAAVAFLGLGAGLALVAFTEAQGERARERGSGLSESMSTRLAGGLLEDVEVSSVSDIGSLTSQLEKALKESGGAKEEELKMSEEDKKRIKEDADDGW
jgi:hypothetical protein